MRKRVSLVQGARGAEFEAPLALMGEGEPPSQPTRESGA